MSKRQTKPNVEWFRQEALESLRQAADDLSHYGVEVEEYLPAGVELTPDIAHQLVGAMLDTDLSEIFDAWGAISGFERAAVVQEVEERKAAERVARKAKRVATRPEALRPEDV